MKNASRWIASQLDGKKVFVRFIRFVCFFVCFGGFLLDLLVDFKGLLHGVCFCLVNCHVVGVFELVYWVVFVCSLMSSVFFILNEEREKKKERKHCSLVLVWSFCLYLQSLWIF